MARQDFWAGKRVFLTGHTGFKGGWLALWLSEMGAEVHGYSLAPDTTPNLFEMVDVAGFCASSTIGDIRDAAALNAAFDAAKPDIVLHLAAQAIVKTGYSDPVGTFDTNVMGTIHVMEAARRLAPGAVCLVVSSDKCYHNPNDGVPLREHDPLGGEDPYSASKGACEIAVQSWLHSFFAGDETPVLCSARAGNVIGGGDWSEARLLPDAARAFSGDAALVIRNPLATRPWQHVLEPLSGYLTLVEKLSADRSLPRSWNFGPIPAVDTSVEKVAAFAAEAWGGTARVEVSTNRQDWKEAVALMLDSTNALRRLDWMPQYDVPQAVGLTMGWYKAFAEGADMRALTLDQIRSYAATAA